jgi:PKD domain-containing protein
LVVVLAAGVLGCWASAAAADEMIAQAIIYKQGEQAPTEVGPVPLATLEATAACDRYVPNSGSTFSIEGPVGSQPLVVTDSTWTLYTILHCALGQTLSAGAGDWVEVQNPNSGTVEAPLFFATAGGLSDLVPPSDFTDQTQVPLVIVDQNDGQLEYYRPQRQTPAGSPVDANANDYFASTEPITIIVSEGGSPPLAVAITEAPATGAAAGQSVTLTAAVSEPQGGAPNPADLAYTWSSSGAGASLASTSGPSVQATFAAAGDYTVSVDVTDDADGTFGADTLQIQIGAAASDSSSGTPSSSDGQSQQPSSPATGPQQSPGSTAGGTAATDPTHHSGTSGPSAGKGAGGATATSKPRRPATTGASSHPAGTTTPARPAPTAAEHPAASISPPTKGGGSTPASHHRHRASHPTVLPRTPLTTPIPASATPDEPRISGRLIGGVALQPAGASPLVHTLAAGGAAAAAVRRGVSASPVAAIAAGLAVVLLLGLGAGRELRWRRRLGARLYGS